MKEFLATILATVIVMTTFTACTEAREKLLEILGVYESDSEVVTEGVIDSEAGLDSDSEMLYNTDGSWYESEYDENGDEIKRTYYYSDGRVWYWCAYFYWTDGSWYEYEFDSEDSLVKISGYDFDGNMKWWCEYEYDSSGNLTVYTDYTADGSICYCEEYEYDSYGNETKYTLYNSDGSMDYCEEYEYDSNGNQTKYKSYNSDGSIDSWYEYEYDSENNITKIREYNSDGSYDEYDALVVPNAVTYADVSGNYLLSFGEYSGVGGSVSYSDAIDSENNYKGTYIAEINEPGVSSVLTITTSIGTIVEFVYDSTLDAMQDLNVGTVYYGLNS